MPQIREVEVTAIVTVQIAATLPANNKTVAAISLDPIYPTETLLTVPLDESWVIEDVYYGAAAPTEDCIMEFLKNLVESVIRTPPLSGMRVDNVARPKITPFQYKGGDIISILGQNLTVGGAAATTETLYVKIRRFTPH